MKKKCRYCGEALPEEASFCLHCFMPLNVVPLEPQQTINRKSNKFFKYVSIVLCVTLLVSTIVIICFHNSKSSNNITPSKVDEQALTTVLSTTKTTETSQNTTIANNDKKTTSTTKKTSTTESTTQQTTTDITTTTKKATTEKATQPPKIIINNGVLINYPDNKTNSSYSIPYSVTKISNNAFNNNKHIKILKFSKQEKVECNWSNLFSGLPNLETIYVYPGTSADLEGLQYFDGEIIYYD